MIKEDIIKGLEGLNDFELKAIKDYINALHLLKKNKPESKAKSKK